MMTNLDGLDSVKQWMTVLVGAAAFSCVAACGDSAGGGNGSDGQPQYLDYIRGEAHPKLVMEVDYVPDYGPRSSVSSDLEEELTSVLDKPEGIEIRTDRTLESRGDDHRWTSQELHQLAGETNDLEVDGETAKIHVLFVDGGYEEDSDDSKVLGLAWGHQNIVIFKENIQEGCERGGLPGNPFGNRICAKAEKTVWIHEVGHVIGLVDNGLEMVEGHRDDEHGKHCDNDDCVMYWAQRTSRVFETLRERFQNDDESALGFDQQCRDDIAEVRE